MKKVLLLLLSITFLLTSCVKKSLLEDAEAEIEVLENQNVSLEGQINLLSGQISTLTNSNASLIAENANIASDLADVNESLAAATASLADANVDIAVLTVQVEGLEEQIADLQYAVDQENVAKLQAKIDLVEKDLIATTKVYTDYRNISDAKVLVTTTSNTLDNELILAAQYQAAYDTLKAQIDTGTSNTSGNLADLYIVLYEHRTGDLKDAQDAYDDAKEIYDEESNRLWDLVVDVQAELDAWIARLSELLADLVL